MENKNISSENLENYGDIFSSQVLNEAKSEVVDNVNLSLDKKRMEYLEFLNSVKLEDFKISKDLKTFKFRGKTYNLHPMKDSKGYVVYFEKFAEENFDPITMWISGNNIYINNIKEEFLLYFLMNEALCPDVSKLKDIDGCLLALKKEFELVPDDQKEEYLKERKKFFIDTKRIYTGGFGLLDLEYEKQLEKCLKFLDNEIKKAKIKF